MKHVLYFKFILIMILILLSFCMEKTIKPDFSNYQEYYFYYAKEICKKMYRCLQPYVRTFRYQSRENLKVEKCISVARKRIFSNQIIHTTEIQKISLQCYRSLLESSCKEFFANSIVNKNCIILKEKVLKEAFPSSSF